VSTSKLAITAVIVVLIIALSQCVGTPDETAGPETLAAADVRGAGYIGAAACSNCHKDIHTSYLATAHRNTSAFPSIAAIKGSFEPGKNAFHYRSNVKVAMEQRSNGLFQVAYMDEQEKQAFPFGVVVGSGRKAQTYLYWYDDNVFQLPVSYSVWANNWVNSPSYPADKVRFDRLINIGCFECHGSYIERKGTQQEGNRMVDYFDKTKVIYGMDCERCHGPAAEHVSFHTSHPEEKKPQHIALYKQLNRQQQTALCAQCHSGGHTTKNSIFYFKPGDSLTQYFSSPISTGRDVSQLDVHGNQYQLLSGSKCYIKSNSLTCTSCHNSHVQERENMAVFSQRCASCHSSVKHSFATQVSANAINNNCIDCHMPALPSRAITMKKEDKTEADPNLVRTHFISNYPEATRKFIEKHKGR
jgi:hypothetical protein